MIWRNTGLYHPLDAIESTSGNLLLGIKEAINGSPLEALGLECTCFPDLNLVGRWKNYGDFHIVVQYGSHCLVAGTRMLPRRSSGSSACDCWQLRPAQVALLGHKRIEMSRVHLSW